MLTFGAQFAKVAVDADLGMVRVRQLAGAFAPGRVLNPVLARSQLMGGMLWGLGQALLEGNHMDPGRGGWGAGNLGEYLVAVNADAPDVDRRVRRGRGRRRRAAGRQGRRRDRAGRVQRRDRQRRVPCDRAPRPRTAHRHRAPAGTPDGGASGHRARARPDPIIDPDHNHPQLRPPSTKRGLQTDRLAAQPWTGLGGLLLAPTAGFFALALGTGSTTTSLLILGPISAFALPAVAVIAFWWNDWPGCSACPALDRAHRHHPGCRSRGLH